MPERSDEQLVVLVLNGNTAAFEDLVRRYEKQIFALAYRLSGDYAESQDMAQEAFLRVYQELSRFDTSRRFFPWMYRVAQNSCLNTLKKRPREQLSEDEEWRRYIANDASVDPAASLERVSRQEAVTAALDQLPASYREPLVLKYLSGLSYQEIADQLDLPLSTIETRLFRGRHMLKKLLAEYL